MAQVSKYRYLLNQYPETVQKEQFRIICHISKRTARYLLQSGLVPCVQSGKKTRNYTIKMKDIVRYLERREIHPEKYKLPPGSYSGTYAVKPLLPESVTTEELRKYYIESFRDIPDIVSTREAAELTGATASTVAKWIRTKKLKALSHGPAFIIPKVNLIDFMLMLFTWPILEQFTPEKVKDLISYYRVHKKPMIELANGWYHIEILGGETLQDGDYEPTFEFVIQPATNEEATINADMNFSFEITSSAY